MQSKIVRLIAAIFLVVGLVLMGGGIWAWSAHNRISSDGLRTQATVIDLEYRRDASQDGGGWAAVFEYQDRDGKTHIHRPNSTSNPPAYSHGETVDIFYLPDAPEQAMVDDFMGRWLLTTILSGMGAVFILLGGSMLALHLRGKHTQARLQKEGVEVLAKFTRCDPDPGIVVQGRTPWRVSAQAQDLESGKYSSYLSPPIWVDLTEALSGKTVPVLVDPSDDGSYWMDLTGYIDEDQFA